MVVAEDDVWKDYNGPEEKAPLLSTYKAWAANATEFVTKLAYISGNQTFARLMANHNKTMLSVMQIALEALRDAQESGLLKQAGLKDLVAKRGKAKWTKIKRLSKNIFQTPSSKNWRRGVGQFF